MMKQCLFLAVLVLVLTVFGCSSRSPANDYIGADEFFRHRLKGDRYRIAGRECRPSEKHRLRELADSARMNSPVSDHSVILSDSDGTPYTLGVGLPNRFERGRACPLVVYLHGGIGTEISNKGERAWEMLGGLRDCVDIFLASPSGNRFAPWWTPRGLSRIIHVVEYMETMYAIDSARIFLAGVSDGATGCYAVASTPSANRPFAGFFAISGFGGMLPDLGVPLLPENMKNKPVYNVQGGQDKLYPISSVNGFIDYLQKNGVPVTSKVYPEEGHGFDYREREFPEFARFIREWRLD
jgi:acetyl esterase/lipase